jgi:hypothetical protein
MIVHQFSAFLPKATNVITGRSSGSSYFDSPSHSQNANSGINNQNNMDLQLRGQLTIHT